jgi:ABC-type phosphate transport system substrate-binding protein
MKLIRTWPRSRAALLAALALAAVLPGCGGGNDTPNTPAVTQPPALVRTLVAEGSFNLIGVGEASRQGFQIDYIRHEFTTSGTGSIEVHADWTFANSQMGIVVGRGSCSFAQIDAALAGNAAACPEAGGSIATSKPALVNVGVQPQNTYTLVIVNPNDQAESGNYQVYQLSVR